ncbi:elongation of very long chain fatty acids protein 1-like [Haliotis rufescens]|uniref:elongation of very long chain fatty acids protein 1-like n=1 Tax=Haliotis rufescens TaxID=6454 RepID=UPI00201FADDA|nr:elongation of very long chain fatty acids protein 1-like [Haliotis rufescens]XP_048248688.1 elongation of very long chain fatty acids protein 1-like [Haliotis rufescens]XP_048248689.1 elongation of very long chain fatty acids protein 1-like [Haliotis rufescens]
MNRAMFLMGLQHVINLPSFPLFCAYLLMIFLSKFWQKWTKPLNLKPLMILHNFTCCLASMYTLYGFINGLYNSDYIYSKTMTEELRFVYWVYWMTKIIELLDTVFMVLRHRQRQISFLHIYHHASMLLLSNVGYKYFPYPNIAIFLVLNSLVHVVLYFYYGLTAVMPNNPPRWRKQLTQMQILQFLLDFVLASYGYMYHNFCFYGLIYGITMTYLFSNFYYHAYVRQKKHPEDKLKSN